MLTLRHLLAVLMFCLLLPQEANAWGLYSHVVYCHDLLSMLHTLPQPLMLAAQRFPSLVMAGACLPDLAVVSSRFRHSHGWGIGQQLLQTDDQPALALAIGYNCHLLTDVVAHQHFVPSFEAKWKHDSILTHATAEWAMDAYLYQRNQSVPMPSQLLRQHHQYIANTLSRSGILDTTRVNQAIKRLARADQLLRVSHIPQMLLHRNRKLDNTFESKLGYYRTQVKLTLNELPKLLNGDFPTLHAEHIHLGMDQLDSWRQKCLQDARLQPTRAIGLFEHYHHQWFKQPDC